MPEQSPVPLIVLSTAREPVEAVNGILRRAGQPAHCTWIPALRDLADALTQLNPEMLVHVTGSREELESAIRVRERLAPGVPVLWLAETADEAQIALALELGARDRVTLANSKRLQAVLPPGRAGFSPRRPPPTTPPPVSGAPPP